MFDPVGAGATGYRTSTALTLMEGFPPSIIRANASEVLAIAGSSRKTKGVDSTHSSDAAIDAARSLVQEFGSVVVISGETDFIVGKERTCQVHNGCSLMSRVTGMGCTATALSGAFAAVNSDYFTAATNSMALMGICGEIASKKAHGPGTFQSLFLDALYEISPDDIESTIRVK